MEKSETEAVQYVLDELIDRVVTESFVDVVISNVECDGGIRSNQIQVYDKQEKLVVALVITRGNRSYSVRRLMSDLYKTLYETTKNQICDDKSIVNLIPSFDARSDAEIASFCNEMTQYIKHAHFLRHNPQWATFLKETSSLDCLSLNKTVSLILQPIPWQHAYVPRASQHSFRIEWKDPDQFLIWQFEIKYYDILFKIMYCDDLESAIVKIIEPENKYTSTEHNMPVEGICPLPLPGCAVLIWDNSYSRIRGKNIKFQVQVVSRAIYNSAIAANDALQEKQTTHSISTLTESIVPSSSYADWSYVPFKPKQWLFPKSETNLEELNLNLLQRVDFLEDALSKTTVEKDQALWKLSTLDADYEELVTTHTLAMKELTLARHEIKRLEHERNVWDSVQDKKDALLMEMNAAFEREKTRASQYRGQRRILINTIKAMQEYIIAESMEAHVHIAHMKEENARLTAQVEALLDSKEQTLSRDSVPNTLNDADLALIHCQPREMRIRLTQFLREHDPSILDQVNILLENYRGIEDTLFESLRIKYQI